MKQGASERGILRNSGVGAWPLVGQMLLRTKAWPQAPKTGEHPETRGLCGAGGRRATDLWGFGQGCTVQAGAGQNFPW